MIFFFYFLPVYQTPAENNIARNGRLRKRQLKRGLRHSERMIFHYSLHTVAPLANWLNRYKLL
jgi:hypothetical protein